MPAGWKPITVQKIIQIQSNLEYCILTGCDWRRWDGGCVCVFFLLPFHTSLFFFLRKKKFQLRFFNAGQTSGDCKHAEVFVLRRIRWRAFRRREREKFCTTFDEGDWRVWPLRAAVFQLTVSTADNLYTHGGGEETLSEWFQASQSRRLTSSVLIADGPSPPSGLGVSRRRLVLSKQAAAATSQWEEWTVF